jgi:hypothetical protein
MGRELACRVWLGCWMCVVVALREGVWGVRRRMELKRSGE